MNSFVFLLFFENNIKQYFGNEVTNLKQNNNSIVKSNILYIKNNVEFFGNSSLKI